MALSCRFYASEFPAVDDTVVVKVHKITEMGAYVSLTGYNNKEGMILLSELSNRRIRSVNQFVRVGRSMCCVVIRVDEKKGYVDLSKRRISTGEIVQCVDRFAKGKCINGILKYVAEKSGLKTNEELESLYMKTAWYFDEKQKRKCAAHEVFKKAMLDPSVLDECDIPDNVKGKLIEEITKKMTPQAVKVRADFEVSCFSYDGIEAIKTALCEGKKCSTEKFPIKINLIAAPHFVATVQTMEHVEGIEVVNKALEAIRTSIETFNGSFKILVPATIDELFSKIIDEDIIEAEEGPEDIIEAEEGLEDIIEAEKGPKEADDQQDSEAQ